MDAKPHTHQIRIDRYYPSLQQGHYEVHYGDTLVKVHQGPFLEWRIRRGVKRAIRKHDEGSISAGAKEQHLAELNQMFAIPDNREAWGSDLLAEKRRS